MYNIYVDILDQILSSLPAALFGIFAVFLVFGMLFGAGRGAKRSLLRLLTVVVFILIAFLITPSLSQWVYGWDISIAGNTPAEWVEEMVQTLRQDESMAYLVPFVPYIKDVVIGLAFALISVILFLLMYLLVKPLSWIVYAILAGIIAPKRNAKGKLNPKHAGWGLLIGAVQGVVLFFFFMLPINSLISITAEVAAYQGYNPETVQAATMADDRLDDALDDDIFTAETNTDQQTGITDTLPEAVQKISQATQGYQNVLRYTGLEFVSRWAFNYQMTVQTNDVSINISNDLVTGAELVIDLNAIEPLIDRLWESDDFAAGLATFSHQDFETVRHIINKVFDFEILKVGDIIFKNFDNILAASITGDETLLTGTDDVCQDSIYGRLTQSLASARIENAPANFVKGLRAMVGYVAEQQFNLVKNDLLQAVNITEDLSILPVAYPDAAHPTSILSALTQNDLTPAAYFDILLAPVTISDHQHGPNAVALDVLFDGFRGLNFYKIISRPDANNIMLYGNWFDEVNFDDANLPNPQKFLRTFSASFMGTTAEKTWNDFQTVSKTVLRLARDFADFNDRITAITERLQDKYPNATDSELSSQALMTYLAELSDDQINNLAEGLNQLVFTFEPVTEYAQEVVESFPLDDFRPLFVKLLATRDVEVWRSTLRSIRDMVVVVNQAQDLLNEIINIDFSDPNATKQLMEKLVDEVNGVDPTQIAGVVYDLLTVGEMNETVEKVLTEFDFAGDNAAVQEEVQQLHDYLENFDAETADETDKEELVNIFNNIWSGLRGQTA